MVKRLTEYFECGAYTTKENVIDVSDKVKFFENGCLMGKVIDKLAQLEDIMEEYGMVDIQDFKDCLESMYDESINAKKLKKFKDIMEKYDIESFELLEHIIKKGMVINSVIEDFAKEEYDKMKQDRDTWKRACELACEREDDCYVYDNIHRAYEFYQQAKKEGEHGN